MIEEKTIKEQIKYKIDNISKLSTLPTVASKIIELVNNPNSSAAHIEKAIATDQVLTARILKMANSAYYGFQKEVATVKLAIVILGFDTIKSLVISCSIIENIKIDSDQTGFNLDEFWSHSIATALIAQRIAKKIGYSMSGEAFVAGLLHDIGVLILVEEVPEIFDRIVQLKNDLTEPISHEDLEMQVMDCTHHEVGNWLMTKWNFPEMLRKAVLSHHSRQNIAENKLGYVVEIADLIACHIGYKGVFELDIIEDDLLEVLTQKQVQDFIPLAKEAVESGSSFFDAFIKH